MIESRTRASRPTLCNGDLASSLAAANASTYSSSRTVRNYMRSRKLFPAERAIIKRHPDNFAGSVLDVAIGAGRTTSVLTRLSRDYVGIDYSEPMVNAARRVLRPEAEPRSQLYTLDMRDIPDAFSRKRFDAILISYNGIDYIPWESRNKLLRGLRPLLGDTGVLVFSTHDLSMREHERRFRVRDDLRIDADLIRRQPLRAVSRLARLGPWLARVLPNRWRNRRLDRVFGDYAYVNDMGDNYGLVTTYVSRQAQIEQLVDFGYDQVDVLHPWLSHGYTAFNYFVCRPYRREAARNRGATRRGAFGAPR